MLDSSLDYQNNIYANVRQIDAKITFTVNGSSDVYDDTYITQMRIIEEMNTQNESLPSNELQVTLDNTSGTFDFLSMSNMHRIIASRPKIAVKLGLHVDKPTWDIFGAKKWSEL
ncbi:hypothetical protein [Neobacillus vireti]|uniref:hypothetical protein n=1 Tax=Neobacillus vireti TaxID=220686 RepID=UPI0030008F4D